MMDYITLFEMAVSIQPAPARDFWPLESRHRHFPNPNPNFNTLKKNFENVKNNHSVGVEHAAYAQCNLNMLPLAKEAIDLVVISPF